MDRRFTQVRNATPDAAFNGERDDPVDDGTNLGPNMMKAVPIDRFDDVYDWEE